MAFTSKPCTCSPHHLSYSSPHNDGAFWRMSWDFLECPHPALRYTEGFFKKGVVESAEIIVHDTALIFKSKRGEFSIPNDPIALEALAKIIEYAKEIQEPFDEDERIENIRVFKRDGYIDSNTCEFNPFGSSSCPRCRSRQEHVKNKSKINKK